MMTIKLSTIDKLRLDIANIARERNKAHEKVEAMVHQLSKAAKPLPEKRFWELVKKLKGELGSTAQKKLDWDTKRAVHNFYCYNFTQNLMEMVQFVKTYDDKVCELYQNKDLAENIEGCGDDSFGDTLDSYPLYGQKRFKRAIEKGNPYQTMEQLEEKDYNAIYQGENYICMSLRNHLTKVAQNMADDMEKPPQKVHVVTVIRTGWGGRDIIIEGAKDEEEARSLAMDKAGDYEFSEHDADYKVEGVREEEL
jgi:hypothetical protein